ncbi:MAG: preprotein translocase subunit SecG [Patescibacteria group bacterium]
MIFWIKISTIVVAVLLTTSILLQQRGSGLGSAFGADVNVYATKRGIERFLYIATIILAAAFLVLSLITLLLSR